MLNLARHFLKVQQQQALQRLREELPRREKPLPRFATWLTTRNVRARVLWRYQRRITPGMDVMPFEFPKIGAMASPYQTYREVILKRYSERLDASRLDAMIALRMRVAGYTRPEVANELHRQARSLRKKQESRDWKQYYARAAWYAFGVAGDIDIAAFEPTPEKILSFHQGAERLEAPRMRLR